MTGTLGQALWDRHFGTGTLGQLVFVEEVASAEVAGGYFGKAGLRSRTRLKHIRTAGMEPAAGGWIYRRRQIAL